MNTMQAHTVESTTDTVQSGFLGQGSTGGYRRLDVARRQASSRWMDILENAVLTLIRK